MEKEIDESDLSALSRIKKIQFLLIKDFYLRTYRDHEEFLNVYEEKVKKIAQMEAKISKEPFFIFNFLKSNKILTLSNSVRSNYTGRDRRALSQ